MIKNKIYFKICYFCPKYRRFLKLPQQDQHKLKFASKFAAHPTSFIT